MLLVLGFDVYTQDPEITSKVVKGEGYDLSKLREDTWEGHPAYVGRRRQGRSEVEAVLGGEGHAVVCARRLNLREAMQAKLDDIRFTDYRPLAGAWVAARVEVHSDDKLVFSEDYTDIQANVKLAPASLRSRTVQHDTLGETKPGRDGSRRSICFGSLLQASTASKPCLTAAGKVARTVPQIMSSCIRPRPAVK